MKITKLKSVHDFCARLQELGIDLPVDDQILMADESPLAEPGQIGSHRVGNRWVIHPMEGWDANRDGSPSEYTLRRWRNFGLSGAKLIWGGEAAAVQPSGRANPQQTLAIPSNKTGLAALREELLKAHREVSDSCDDLVIGLQLTHSGRFCRPNDKQLEPRIAYHHPLLDKKFSIDPQDDSVVWSDDDLYRLIDDFVVAARLAQEVGYQFVDVKACHGYLLHEFLSATTRPGDFGGGFAGRTRLLKTIIQRVQQECPDLSIVVRLSVFDTLPFQTSHEVGQPMAWPDGQPYPYGFGVDANDPSKQDLTEPIQLIRELQEAGVIAVNITCGSPYYNPHVQRPAIFPPSDGYQPPEDPLVGVARQIHAARECKQAVPDMPMVGTGYTYLQDYLPQVAQAVVRKGWIDYVGLGRMVLSYPQLPLDTLRDGEMRRKLVCRTFSDCTTAPRNGLLSGCFPLDLYYKGLPDAKELRLVKNRQAKQLREMKEG
ncbi:MAG: NADH:flavin oxidoreductase [Planctomycetaceae bacterium]|nr:NADH:flavin oxidoreductase [Planctomycetaceae bacterium]